MGVIAVVQQRMDSLALDIAAYRTLDEKYNALSDKYEEDYENKEIYLDSYEEYLTQLEDGLNNKTFDPSEVDSIQPRADRILKQAVLESLQEPDGLREVTSLLTNRISLMRRTGGARRVAVILSMTIPAWLNFGMPKGAMVRFIRN